VPIAFYFTLLYVGLVYVRPQEFVLALRDVPVLPIVLIGSSILWLTKRDKNFEASQHRLLPLLLFIMALSVAANGWLGGALETVTAFLPTLVLFYLISTTTDTIAKHRLFMKTLAIITTVLALHGIDQVQTGIGWSSARVTDGNRITYLGIFNDPNDLALAFLIVLPMLGYCLSEAKLLIGKAIWLMAIAINLYALFLTNSRGGMLGAIALFIIYFYSRFGLIRSLGVAAIGLFALALLPSRLSTLDASEESAAGRIDAWYEGIRMLIHHPLIGVGKGNFTDHHDLTAHNSIVLVFAELGLVGYFIWLAFVGLSAWMVYKMAKTGAEQMGSVAAAGTDDWPEYAKVSRTYFYSLLGFLIPAFFLSRSYNILLFMLCALCAALYQNVRRQWPAFSPITFGQIAGKTVVFEVGSIVLMYFLIKMLLLLGK
jgi:putative inorganic carbon (hco3(-)) transporter